MACSSTTTEGTTTSRPLWQPRLMSRNTREPDDTEAASHQARPRDWGSRWFNYPLVGANTDVGLFLGGIVRRDTYGFRHHPYKNRLSLSAAINPIEFGVSGQLEYDFSIRRAALRGIFDIEGSTREVRRYFGVGNLTESSDADEFFRADRAYIGANLGIEPTLPEGWWFSVAPVFRFSTPVDEEATFLAAERPRPYGFDDFSQAGLVGGLTWDSRDEPAFPTRGGLLEIEGRYYPSILDVDEPYGGHSRIRVDQPRARRTRAVAQGPSREGLGNLPLLRRCPARGLHNSSRVYVRSIRG